ncbi:subunit of the Arp2/3 complex [Clydaea vesicula]|uniref:Actin-related protein 2/3 complex subunit 3 n=1 Tax=Clydaea vesicula TaxID=447962 RepID=A0AAD5XTR4_9FUNG|nr:subunit of the Arp2/3 complex [Clydaea vesicula]KAJ3381563.1 subunit of the Arp2/3 complex [Lobulomyces angularis]
MPAYHTQFTDENNYRVIGNISMLPIKTKTRGPAPIFPGDGEDIIDETINLFRANCFFRNFEVKGGGDRVLIYLTLFITECLQKLSQKPLQSQQEGLRALNTLAVGNFLIPGDGGFPLNALFERPANKVDSENMRNYLMQLRNEMAIRLCSRVFEQDKISKWWLCFSKRKFMGINGG